MGKMHQYRRRIYRKGVIVWCSGMYVVVVFILFYIHFFKVQVNLGPPSYKNDQIKVKEMGHSI
jgi:uncharacterized membrane protein YvbJ